MKTTILRHGILWITKGEGWECPECNKRNPKRVSVFDYRTKPDNIGVHAIIECADCLCSFSISREATLEEANEAERQSKGEELNIPVETEELRGKNGKPSIEEIEKAGAEGRDPRIQPDGTVLVKPKK